MMQSSELRQSLKSQPAKDPGCWSGWGLNPRPPRAQQKTVALPTTKQATLPF